MVLATKIHNGSYELWLVVVTPHPTVVGGLWLVPSLGASRLCASSWPSLARENGDAARGSWAPKLGCF